MRYHSVSHVFIKMCDYDNYADDEDFKEYEIDEIMMHDYNFEKNEYSFLCKSGDETFWVNDDDCQCEEKIQKYIVDKDLKINTIYCFCRVSSINQVRWSSSFERQKQNVLDFAYSIKGNYRIKTIEAVCSTFKEPCDYFVDILKIATKGDMILVNTIDRLSRNTNMLSHLFDALEKKVVIHSIEDKVTFSEKTANIFYRKMVEAHTESEKIGERIKRGYEYKHKYGF